MLDIGTRELLRSVLEEDYELIFAENGQEALDAIRANRDDLSLVLLDLLMPVMSGKDALRAMKADPEIASIPVIVLTSDQNAEIESLTLWVRYREVGADVEIVDAYYHRMQVV